MEAKLTPGRVDQPSHTCPPAFRPSSARQKLVCEGTTSRRIWEITGLCPIHRLSMKNRSAGIITPKIPHSSHPFLRGDAPLPCSQPSAAICETAAGHNARMVRAAVLALAGVPVDALSAQVIGVVLAASSPSVLPATDGAVRS